MRIRADTCIALIGGFLTGLIIGAAIGGMCIEYMYRTEAAAHGHASWVLNGDGSCTWKWNDAVESMQVTIE